MPYSGTMDCTKTARSEGGGAVLRLVPTAARQVPLNMVRFISVEAMKKLLANVD